MEEKIAAGKFKAQCLYIMEQVRLKGRRFIITKRNKPVAKLVPIQEKQDSVFGKFKGTVVITGDIVSPIDEEWNACTGTC